MGDRLRIYIKEDSSKWLTVVSLKGTDIGDCIFGIVLSTAVIAPQLYAIVHIGWFHLECVTKHDTICDICDGKMFRMYTKHTSVRALGSLGF